MKPFTYRIIIEPDENYTFHGYVPTLPGCHTWGRTLNEVKIKLREAIEVYVADMIADGEAIPEEQNFESFETVFIPEVGQAS